MCVCKLFENMGEMRKSGIIMNFLNEAGEAEEFPRVGWPRSVQGFSRHGS